MEVSPKTYKRLWDLLKEGFSKAAFPDAEKPPSMKELFNAPFKINGKNADYSEYLFGAPLKYFYNLRSQANNGGDVPVQNLRLVKVLEFIEDIPEKLQYSGLDWEAHAKLLLEKFEKKYLPVDNKEIDTSPHTNEDLENIFISVITERKEIFESKIIKSLVSKYYTALKEKRTLDAWELLSPNLRRRSLWDGDFFLFDVAQNFFNDILTQITIIDFSYSFQSVKCKAVYESRVHVFNLEKYYDAPEFKNALLKISNFRILRKFEKNKALLRDNKSGLFWPIALKKTSELFSKELNDPYLQVLLLISYTQTATAGEKEPLSQMVIDSPFPGDFGKNRHISFKADLTCVYFNDKWLIDQISESPTVDKKNTSNWPYFFPLY
jgi:hypothetical protein